MSNNNQSENKNPEDNILEEHRLDYFRHNQIVFLVTHEDVKDDQLPDEILMAWTQRLTKQLYDKGWRLDTNIPIRSYSFPVVGENLFKKVPYPYSEEKFTRAFSIIVCNVENERNKIAKLGLLDLISKLGEETQRDEFLTAELRVEGVFPNWIASSSASDSGGTGGPGGRPVPYSGSLEQVPYYFQDLISQLDGANPKGKKLYGKGAGVDVIILDTSPSTHDLVLAHKELSQRKEKGKEHPLIKDLLGQTGRLKLYPATYEEHIRMGNTSLNKHGYKMTDHGLFIAGIIHSIVPDATIHLIEVLNQFGVGDLETIARGLTKAYAISLQSQKGAPVNSSLYFDVSNLNEDLPYRPINEVIPQTERDMEAELRARLNHQSMQLGFAAGDRAAIEELPWVLALRSMCERLAKAGRQVIAAAGNEAQDAGETRDAPNAGYPAAFSKVVGVGALPKDARINGNNGNKKASSFSSLADTPPHSGIMALGGEPGEGNGVLGLYLGEFPPENSNPSQSKRESGWSKSGPKSENGWAWWAGTSFATPIVTAAVASVMSGPEGNGTTQNALDLLYEACIIEEAITAKNEDGILSSLTQVVKPRQPA